jgi:hypothetical protein
MTKNVELTKTELYQTLLDLLFGEVPRLRNEMANGPLDGVAEAHDKLVTALMSIRSIARALAEVDDKRAVALMLLESQMTVEVLKLTQLASAPVATAPTGDSSRKAGSCAA